MGDIVKRIAIIHTPDETRIDPAFCPHQSVLHYTVGGVYLAQGEATDDTCDYEVCLDCGRERKVEGVDHDVIPF